MYYDGRFGLETGRMDKSAVGHEYVGKVEKHGSQKGISISHNQLNIYITFYSIGISSI